MSDPPTADEFLARIRASRSPSDPFRLAVESIQPLTPEAVRRHLPLLLALARVRED